MGSEQRSPNALRVQRACDVKIDHLPYKYPTRSAVTLEAEIRQIAIASSLGLPGVQLGEIKDEVLCVVGYGPSLQETWVEVTHPCLTVSGAHDFLLDRGITPDYHVECDGRDHKTKHLERATDSTHYLMATICNPRMWELLKGKKVSLWHNTNGQHVIDWLGENGGGVLVAGGSVVGLSSIHVAGILGYRKFKCFGFDGNFRGDDRHAGPHYGPSQRVIDRNGWKTTPQMSNACDEMLQLMMDESVSIEIVGDSLMKSLIGVSSWR